MGPRDARRDIAADQREARPKEYTSHEVTALRAGGPSTAPGRRLLPAVVP